MTKEAIASYAIQCEGVARDNLVPLRSNPINVSITVYKNGAREVGCPLLKDGKCLAAYLTQRAEATCVQLSPSIKADSVKPESEKQPEIQYLHPIEFPPDATFGYVTKAYIHRAGLTQKALAMLSGVDSTHLNKIISDQRNAPRFIKMSKLATALRLSPDEKEDFYRRGGYVYDSEERAYYLRRERPRI